MLVFLKQVFPLFFAFPGVLPQGAKNCIRKANCLAHRTTKPSPPQELEDFQRSGSYLLVCHKKCLNTNHIYLSKIDVQVRNIEDKYIYIFFFKFFKLPLVLVNTVLCLIRAYLMWAKREKNYLFCLKWFTLTKVNGIQLN